MNKKNPLSIILGIVVIVAVVVLVIVQNTGSTDNTAAQTDSTPTVNSTTTQKQTTTPTKPTTPSTGSTNISTNTTTSGSTTTSSTTPKTTAGQYTMADVAGHNSRSSCWTAINGGVYDVTKWITQHPGGQQAILSLCGTDGSDAFNGQHGGQRRPASELAAFKIGVLAQ